MSTIRDLITYRPWVREPFSTVTLDLVRVVAIQTCRRIDPLSYAMIPHQTGWYVAVTYDTGHQFCVYDGEHRGLGLDEQEAACNAVAADLLHAVRGTP